MILLICGILKNDTDKLIYKTETDSQTWRTNLWLPVGKSRGRDKLGFRTVQTDTLKIDNQQGLMYSTENSIQYSVIT